MTRIAVALAVLFTLPAAAIAANPMYDVWQGKVGKTSTVYIVRQVGQSKVTASITYQCKDDAGMVHDGSASLAGTSHGTKLKLKGAANGKDGVAKLTATLKRKRAKGTIKVSLPKIDNAPACKVSHAFSLKGIRTAGG